MANTRRRGADLEQAIFDAVWAELAEHGYAALTMDGIAARARTSKPVLYRRWPNPPALVIAALAHRAPAANALPDTGDLRTDLVVFLHRIAHRFDHLPDGAVHGVMVDTLRDPALRARFTSQLIQTLRLDAVETIMRRATDRGEIAGGLSPRVTALPLTLLREDFLTHAHPPGDEVIAEIVDDIVVPLLRAQQ